jgi:hypothetical protein
MQRSSSYSTQPVPSSTSSNRDLTASASEKARAAANPVSMPPRSSQQQHQAEDAARKLHTLLHSRQVRQLLQEFPPARLTVQQVSQITNCCNTMQQFADAWMNTAEEEEVKHVAVAVIRKHKACYSVSMLLAWLLRVPQQPQQRQQQQQMRQQQQQQQQQLPLGFLLQEHGTQSMLATTWRRASSIVHALCTAAQQLESSGAVYEAAVQLAEQLEQAGELLSVTCGDSIRAFALAVSACKATLQIATHLTCLVYGSSL